MKRKKEFFGVLISVLLCVFLVVLAVYATTTISEDITIGNGGGMRIGTGSNADNFTVLDDDTLFIEGILEVDGAAWFDSTASISGTLTVDGNVTFEADASVSVDFEVGSDKFTVAGSSGNTVVVGTLDVTGLASFVNASISSDFEVGSDKFTVAGLSGNTVVVGTLDVTGLASFAGAASVSAGDLSVESGNFSVGGTAYFAGDVTMNEDVFITLEDAADHMVISQRSESGIEGQPLVLISDTREGGSVDESGEASLSITGEGYGLQVIAHTYFEGNFAVNGTSIFDGLVSVSSDGLLLDGGATIIAGIASQSASCVIGSLYINTELGNLSICDGDGNWTPLTID